MRIPDPDKPPMPPILPFGGDDEHIRVLIMTVNMLTKKIDELVNDVLFKLDGKASERISDSIIRLLDNIEQKN